jgi:diguanylate cyclase (GGDEF)-like protein
MGIRNLLGNKGKAERLMKFQAELLKTLALSSDSLKHWRKRTSSLLIEAGDVLDVCFAFTFQPGPDEQYTLDLFWQVTPPPGTRQIVEEMVLKQIAASPAFATVPPYSLVQSTALPDRMQPDFSTLRVSIEAREVVGDDPSARGMVGVGIRSGQKWSGLERIASDSMLTALMDIAVSVRTIAIYTREVERFATRDPLTNLYNQISFWDLLKYETERSKRQRYKFSLLAIDIDNFKTVNDTYGHEIGDSYLKSFSTVLRTAVRGGDIAARYDGDQFTAILPVCDEGQAYIVAQRFIESVRQLSLPLPDGGTLRGTASVGVAVYPDHAQEARDLYLLADSKLSQAKSFGKDRLSMPNDQDSIATLKSISEKNIMILEALSRKQFVPYFQPIMNIKTMQIEAYEVLTRIVVGDRVVAAAEFIETAEGMGAIGKIDYQLIDMAFSRVRERNYTGHLFLNLSPKALVLNEFMPTVRRFLTDYHIDPSKMVFEITERDTVKNLSLVEEFVHDLKSEGFRFAIDDFGAGYSSYQYLKTFSVDYLKVDGEFIRNMGENGSTEKAIVKSIASLADNLGIKTIAEYVETQAILGQVESTGIGYAQGYYIRRPSPDLQ